MGPTQLTNNHIKTMGTWGHKPLENDAAQDLVSDFNDAKKVSVLENALDTVIKLKPDQYLEAPGAEQAIAAAQVVRDLSSDNIKEEDRNRLMEKSNRALKRILEDSELKELWSESDECKDWIASVEALIIK